MYICEFFHILYLHLLCKLKSTRRILNLFHRTHLLDYTHSTANIIHQRSLMAAAAAASFYIHFIDNFKIDEKYMNMNLLTEYSADTMSPSIKNNSIKIFIFFFVYII